MEDAQKLSRRDFLRLSAVTAASAMLAACGTATTPQGSATTAPGAAATTASGAAATTAPGAAATTTGGAAPAGTATTAATAGTAPGANSGGVALENGTAVGLAAPSTRGEAPMLAALVKAGKLPPLDQRLPKNPYVVPHAWMTIGKYGGTLQTSSSGSSDWGLGHLVQESMYGNAMLRYLKDGQEVGPGL
ncbi:MAG TPA: twin-arginine translocation signal domain-containing protein, partial [Herpetosiphonaceae bacterium]|nr:twin-arginine translocation signal domain-containing protein [Herpetosiphonaceae bacterium]